MKTVKLKIRKGISLLYAGIFVYTFSACSAGRTEQQPNSVSQDEQQSVIYRRFHCRSTDSVWQSARLSIKRYIHLLWHTVWGKHGGRKPFHASPRTRALGGHPSSGLLGRYGSADYDRQVPQHIHYIYRPLELLWRQRGLSDAKHLDARLGRHEETPCAGMDSWRRFYKWQ